MSTRILALIGVLAFSVALAVIVGSQLTSPQALAVGLGVGLGVSVGVLLGVLIARLTPRTRRLELRDGERVTALVMSADEAAALIKVLDRAAAQPETAAQPVTPPTRRRELTSIGGATFSGDE
ncbi:MAG: hypothetical protein IT326_00150 [Anaerolineae bacterium]|nr:hypothetical protein [Anaerolineae bacterium]